MPEFLLVYWHPSCKQYTHIRAHTRSRNIDEELRGNVELVNLYIALHFVPYSHTNTHTHTHIHVYIHVWSEMSVWVLYEEWKMLCSDRPSMSPHWNTRFYDFFIDVSGFFAFNRSYIHRFTFLSFILTYFFNVPDRCV